MVESSLLGAFLPNLDFAERAAMPAADFTPLAPPLAALRALLPAFQAWFFALYPALRAAVVALNLAALAPRRVASAYLPALVFFSFSAAPLRFAACEFLKRLA